MQFLFANGTVVTDIGPQACEVHKLAVKIIFCCWRPCFPRQTQRDARGLEVWNPESKLPTCDLRSSAAFSCLHYRTTTRALVDKGSRPIISVMSDTCVVPAILPASMKRLVL